MTVDNGGEFVSRAMDLWAYTHDVKLELIRPGKPVENAFIASFIGRLRDECLNSHVFLWVAEAQHELQRWRDDYNRIRPHSAPGDRPPEQWAEMARHVTASREAGELDRGPEDRVEKEMQLAS